MESNLDRIIKDIETITSFNKTPGEGFTRFSYSHEDMQARKYLLKEMEKLNLEVTIDGVGNIRGKYNPMRSEEASIMIGSHIDTVLHGGKFDGLAGVVTALETIRVVHENKIDIKRPLELIIWAEEEGSNSGVTMLGSKAMIGKCKVDDLKEVKDLNGNPMYDLIRDFGLEVDKIETQTLKKGEVEYLIELHIEQGAILDTENLSVGVVKAIAGMRTYKVTLEGISNHAGSTPMYLRNDPLVGASHIIAYMEEAAKTKGLPNSVATVGKISCQPNVPNVIPNKIEFYVDIRDVEEEGKRLVSEELKKKVKEIEKEYGLKSSIELLGESPAVKLSKDVIDIVEETVKAKNYPYMLINSGAVHDSAMLVDHAKVGMIFVPSIEGKSHSPEEDTKLEDIKLGCDVLLGSTIKLAKK